MVGLGKSPDPTKPASNKKIIGNIKKLHTNIFIDQTGCGKTHLVLELIEKEYNKYFDYVVIICPTLQKVIPNILKFVL